MKGKVVLVTGGGTGIGAGIAREVVRHGGSVVVSGRREEPLKKICEELGTSRAAYVRGDVRDPASCANMVKMAEDRFGRLDMLVNNAAGNFVTAMEDLSPNAFKTVMEIDLHGSFNMSKAALPLLSQSKGLIVSITATLYYKAAPFQFHASAAKAAIDVMTNSMGVEFAAEHGVRAVSVAPGPIADTVGGPTGRVFGQKGRELSPRAAIPVGRFGTVQDIAYTCLFLASEAGSFINATKIVVDGGHWHEASGPFLAGRKAVREKSEKEKRETKGGVAKL